MALRIHFTAADLARTRISPTLGPLAETIWAFSLLRCPLQSRRLFSEWRAQARADLAPKSGPLAALVPPGSRGVDLCTLVGQATTIENGLETLLAAGRAHLLTEIEAFDRVCKLPSAAWDVADPESTGRRQLASAVDAAYRALVEPHWTRVRAHLHAEQLLHGHILAHRGVDALLATLQSQRIRWQHPILTLRAAGSADLYLNGRGLILIPSLFVGEIPALHFDLRDDSAAPMLMFPAGAGETAVRHLWREDPSAGKALAALLGRTRAAVLSTIADGCTTTELARRVGISIGAASQHATILREAGLITTRRQGSAVIHLLTPLGAELLQSGAGPEPFSGLGQRR